MWIFLVWEPIVFVVEPRVFNGYHLSCHLHLNITWEHRNLTEYLLGTSREENTYDFNCCYRFLQHGMR